MEGFVQDSFPAPLESTTKKRKNRKPRIAPADTPDLVRERMAQWISFDLERNLVIGLQQLGFTEPTEIQQRVLEVKEDRDILGAAQTGSGKTLAFGLPILNNLLKIESRQGCYALILVPTRELAMQVTEHLENVSKFSNVQIISIVGGFFPLKQQRLIASDPDIIVATPGRLWDLASNDESFLATLQNTRYLVLDEADRMLEAGHFKDLTAILNAISLKRVPMVNEWDSVTPAEKPTTGDLQRTTMLFSATLMPEFQHLKKSNKKKSKKKAPSTSLDPTLDNLIQKIEFQDPCPLYINVVPCESKLATGLLESKIDCLLEEKDLYLYYLLVHYPKTRTLVFVNSIDCIRRLVPLLTLLQFKVWGLHAEMQQKQRLKNLERFRANTHSILVSSDVSARGLDIPNVDHVIHYQLPRTADLYVHRSGRTARARTEGVSVALIAPSEVKLYRKISHVLNKKDGFPEFPIDHSILSEMKHRVTLARKIDKEEHALKKIHVEDSWLKKAAKEADLMLEDDDASDSEREATSRKHLDAASLWKSELQKLLKQPLIPRGVSRKYITKNVGDVPQTMLNNRMSMLPTKRASTSIEDLKEKALKRIRGVNIVRK